jgi:hypothetical protein
MENIPSDSDNNEEDRLLTPERQEQLLDEASRTVSGLKRVVDPREVSVLESEEARLRKIADELIPPPTET